jgi:hypothetical protein
MKTKMMIIVFFIIFLFTTVHAQTAKNAIFALKELQARCEAGISLRDYAPALGKVKFQVNQFLENKEETSKSKELNGHIFKAMFYYEYALDAWKAKSPRTGIIQKNWEPLIIKAYPQTDKLIDEGGARVISNSAGMQLNYLMPSSVLSIIWNEASKEIVNADKILVQFKDQKSYEELLKENQDLKEKNESLKLEIDKIKQSSKKGKK